MILILMWQPPLIKEGCHSCHLEEGGHAGIPSTDTSPSEDTVLAVWQQQHNCCYSQEGYHDILSREGRLRRGHL